MQRKKIKVVIGKDYLNPHINKKFKVLAIAVPPSTAFVKETEEKVQIQYEDCEPKWLSFNILQPMIQQTVTKRNVAGVDCTVNLGTDNFPMFLDELKRSGANAGSKAHQIMQKIKDDYRKEMPEEWRGKENEWIYKESPKAKGHLIKKMYLSFIDSADTREVEKNPANNTDNGIEIYTSDPGHDGVVAGRKKAIRMSCKFDNSFTFFQIRQEQVWDGLVFVFVHPEHVEIYEIEKKNFIAYLKEHENEIVWAGGLEKRNEVEGKIERNDLFHWKVKLPLTDMENLRLYGFSRVL